MENEETGVKDVGAASPTASEVSEIAGTPEQTSEVADKGLESQSEGVTSTDEKQTTGEKNYTKEEVQEIVHARTKEMAELKSKLEATQRYLYEQSKKYNANPAQSENKLGDDEVKFKEYIYKLIPELKLLEKVKPELFDKLPGIVSKDESSYNAYVDVTEKEIGKYCSEKGIAAENIDNFKHYVAATIANSPALLAKWEARDVSVLADAFKVMEKGFIEPFANARVKGLSQTKQEVGNLKRPLSGGVMSPTNTEKKSPSFSELSGKAFDALQERLKSK